MKIKQVNISVNYNKYQLLKFVPYIFLDDVKKHVEYS